MLRQNVRAARGAGTVRSRRDGSAQQKLAAAPEKNPQRRNVDDWHGFLRCARGAAGTARVAAYPQRCVCLADMGFPRMLRMLRQKFGLAREREPCAVARRERPP